ncbi:NACHT domain-containing protein [Micromonospora sp. NPDC047793]|uniref:NACHT domain-containing protein n=1 Tax=Micromonospora sp. NPDC047793 TaxID=3154342 RepID=UPI0033CAD78B
MSGLEVAAITLGTAVAKTVCEVWLGDHKIVTGAATGVIDLAGHRLASAREKRRFRRIWEQTAELIADRVEPLIRHEFRDVQENEALAAVDAVRLTFTTAALTDADLFAQDLDAGYLDRHLRSQDLGRAQRSGLSEAATSLYDLLLRECSAYTIETVRTLPAAAGGAALAELLRRERQILDELRIVLERLPTRRGIVDFERDYRQLVANRLDNIEFFGATLAESSRRYPLSVAYLSLTVSGEFSLRRADEPVIQPADQQPRGASSARIDEILAVTRRLFVRGHAGLGKTTLLQWIAVNSARRTFGAHLRDWNDTVPFFVALRRHTDGNLPAPENFLTEIGRHISAEMPAGWVHEQMRSGRAILLIDGVDELTADRRDDARHWLRELVATFPNVRFIITSRPAAAPVEWLGREDFDVAELEPMSRTDVPVFISRWHDAIREQSAQQADLDELVEYEQRLVRSLSEHRHLRQLAPYPLLCALLCALHRDRRGQLPSSRMELYEVALQMLLERRDSERRVSGLETLSRTDKTLLLRDIAYWLVRNGWSAVPADRVRARIAAKLQSMAQISASANEVYQLLLERSGLIREAVEGETDFVHRTFQEYLAAAEAVATDDIGALVVNAYTDFWSEVIVMAAGHASVSQRTELLHGLLIRSGQDLPPATRDALRLLAIACLETSPEVPPALRQEVHKATAKLLPPNTMTTARLLARAGAFTLDLLAQSEPRTANEATATIRAAAEIADPAGLALLARFGRDRRRSVQRELLRAWRRFDPDEYAQKVLADLPFDNGRLEVDDPNLTSALPRLANLTSLYCTYSRSFAGLAFLTALPRLIHLDTQDGTIADLSPLAGTNLQTFDIYGWRAPEDPPRDLTPLSDAIALEELALWSGQVSNTAALTRCPRLRKLRLEHLGTLDALNDLTPLTDLELLGVGHVQDLNDLSPLAFLRAPKALGITSCPVAEKLHQLERWAESLTHLNLRGFDELDLAQLAGLTHLEFLDVQSSKVHNLSALAQLTNLKILWFSADTTGLNALREIRSLQYALMSGPEPPNGIDLSQLADMTHLTVAVPRTARVHTPKYGGPRVRKNRY